MSKIKELAQSYSETVAQEQALRDRFRETVDQKREAAIAGIRQAVRELVDAALDGTPFTATVQLAMRDTGHIAE